jgi:uncharacterized protein (DUF433 family)/DNA-binding transcriptional MerR regulator
VDQRLFDVGLYSVAEASRLTGVPASSIRRWLWGERSSANNGRLRVLSPLWNPQPPTVNGVRTLGFLDLVELRFVQALRRRGVGLPEIRELHRRAQTELDCSHPFSSLRFKSEGGRLAAENGRGKVVDALAPLYEDLDHSESGVAMRWWPRGRQSQVVIDPRRNFGHPIVHDESVSTEVLAGGYLTEGSIESVAHWYEVSDAAVRDAVAFHHRSAA